MFNQYFESLALWVLQTLIIIILIFLGLFLLILFIFKLIGRRIEHPLIQCMIEFFGIYYLDNSDTTIRLKNINRVLGNQFVAKKLILVVGDFNPHSIDKYSISSINEGEINVNVSPTSVSMYLTETYFSGKYFPHFAKLIKYYRSQVPVNAVVITLALDKTYSAEELENIATQLKNLDGYQNYPIYLVLDKLSTIAGFNSFYKLADPNIIIGCTREINSDYSTSDVIAKQIQEHIINSLNKLIDTKLVDGVKDTNISDLIIFVSTLQEILSTNLQIIIQKLSYNNANNFLRGLYICDSQSDMFCKNLFCNLIQADNLVKIKNFSIKSFIINNIFIFIILCLILCLPFTNQQLSKKSTIVLSCLTDLEQISKHDNNYLIVSKLINNIKDIKANIPVSVFIPISWLDHLRLKINNALVYYYQRLFVNKIYSEYDNAIKAITSANFKPSYTKLAKDDLFNSTAFLDLYYYTAEVIRIEKISKLMMNISKHSSIDDIKILVHELFNFDLPDEYFNYSEYFKAAYHKIQITPFKDYQHAIYNVFNQKLDIFFEYYHNLNGFFKIINGIKVSLDLMKDNTEAYSIKDVSDLLEQCAQANEFLTNHKLDWGQLSTLDYLNAATDSAQLKELVNMLDMAQIFEKDFIDNFTTRLKNENFKLNRMISNLELPVIGLLFDNTSVTPGFTNLFGLLKQLKDDGLLANKTLVRGLNIDNHTATWNSSIIKELVNIVDGFDSKFKAKIDSKNGYLYRVITNVFNQKLIYDLNLALENSALSSIDPKIELNNRVNNFVQNLANLLTIVSFAKSNELTILYEGLIRILVGQQEKLLTDLYALIDKNGVYMVNENTIMSNASDQNFIRSFIDSNRDELQKLFDTAKPMIESVASLYKNNAFLMESEIYKKWKEIKFYFDFTADTSLVEFGLFFEKLFNSKTIDSLMQFYNSQKNIGQNTFIDSRKAIILQMVQNKINTYLSGAVNSLYTKVYMNYEKFLKGYFPFGDYRCPDLPKDKMMAFYATWLQDKNEIMSILDSFKNDIKVTKEYTFLMQIVKAMGWIQHIINPTEYPCSAIMQIRVMREAEQLAEQLDSWSISCYGQNSLIQDPSNDKVRDRLFGFMNQTIKLDCLTYSDIDMLQKLSPASEYLFDKPGDQAVNGFSYNSNFALLRLIAMNFYQQYNDVIYLKFQYPMILKNTMSKANLICFLSIKLTGLEYFSFDR